MGEGDIAFFEVFAVAVDGLAEERDFFGAEFGESAYFGDDVIGGAGAFAAPGGGDDAKGAEFIASVLDGDVGFCFACAF